MCGGTVRDLQKAADSAIRGVQEAADSAVNQATGNTSSSSGGKGAPVTTPVFNMPSFGGISGGFTVPEINLPSSPIKINIPTPNLDQPIVPPVVNETVNNVVEQVEGINVPTPNLDQDLTKVNTQTVQNAVVDVGSAVQEQVVQSGAAGQQAAIDAASAAQTNAINTGTILSGGQSNPTLEAAADTVTNNTESLVAEATKYIENKVVPDVRNVFKDFEALTPRIEQTGMMLNPGTVQGTEGAGNPQLSADTPNLGDDQVFGDLEKATGKDGKLTEEERLKRIRRLLLNRYGREDTILTTGPGDTRSRRRYAI